MSSKKDLVISGSGGKGGGGHTPVESNDTLISLQTVRLLLAVSEGEIQSIDDILLNKVSISNYRATYQYVTGTASQNVIPGFVNTEAPLTMTPAIISNSSTTYDSSFNVIVSGTVNPLGTFSYTIGGTVDAVRLTFNFNSLKHFLDNGDLVGYSVNFSIYTKDTPGGIWTYYADTTKTGKASNSYSWDVIVNRPVTTAGTGSWQVAIVRNTIDDNTVKIISTTSISAVTQLYYKTLTYPGTALVGITLYGADQFSGQEPSILIKGKGIKVKIPNNYNPVARTYSGTWDLGMNPVKQFTNNIAWNIYFVLNDPTALGIDSVDIDKVSFYQLSVYSDNLVPDGYGGTIPRYTIGMQYFNRDNVPTFLQGLLSLCNGTLTTNEYGQIKIVFDQPGIQPTRLVTNANVLGGIFNYSSNDLENRYTLANVTYNNFSSYSETNTATWQGDGYVNGTYNSSFDLISRYGLQPIDVLLPGCTTEAQAIRKARWVIYTNAITNRLITYNVGFEGLAYRIGSVVKLMDSDNMGVMQHGIIVSSSLTTGVTTLNIDRSITLGSSPYTISFYGTDAITIYTKTINEISSTVSAFTYTGTEVPLIGSNFILSSSVVPQLFKVVGIDKNETDFTITGLVQDENKYTYIDNGITLASSTGDFVNVTTFSIAPITNLVVTPNSYSDGINSNIQFHVHWDWNLLGTVKYKATFEASWKRDNLDLNYVTQIQGQSFDINNAVPGTYIINVWAINPISGIKSSPVTITYNYKATGGTSDLFPPVNARVSGTSGLTYTTASMSLLFDYNTANNAITVTDGLYDYIVELWDTSGVTKYGTYSVKPDQNKNGLFVLTLADNITLFGSATRQYQIKLYSRDLTGFLSTAYAIVVNNNPPATASFTSYPGGVSVFISVTSTPESDVAGYVVYRSLTSGFTPGVTSDALLPIYDGPDTYIALTVPDTQTYYYKVASYDTFGKTGLNFSSQQTATAVSLDAITWSLSNIVFSIGTTNQLLWTSGTIRRNTTVSTTYSISAGSFTWTTGILYIYFNPAISTTALQTTTTLGIAVGIGCYPVATYTGGSASNIKGGDGSAFISGSQLIAGTVGASQIIAGSIVASLLDTTNAVITNEAQIASAVVNNAAIKDFIQSTNYSTTAHTGWKLDKAGTFNSYGAINLYDTSGNTIFASGTGFNWNNVTGTGIPAVGANVAGNSGNLLTNAGMYLGTDGWSGSGSLALNMSTWCIKNGGASQGTCYVSAGLPSDPAQFIVSPYIPCIPGQLIEFSSYTGSHRCTSAIYVECFDASDTLLGYNWSTAQNTALAFGGMYLSGYMRLGGFFTVPANAVKMRLVGWKNVTYSGQINSYLFLTLPYVGIASPNQTVLSDWSDGSSGATSQINSANISTYMASAAIQTAYIADANVSTLKIAGNAVTIPASATGTSSASVVMDSGGSPVIIIATISGVPDQGGSAPNQYGYLKAGSTTLYTATSKGAYNYDTGSTIIYSYPDMSIVYKYNPSSGNVTYTLSGPTSSIINLLVLAVKR